MRKLSLPLLQIIMRQSAGARTRWAERIDRFGLSLFLFLLCFAFFFLLWGRIAPSVFAASALNALMLPPLLRLENRLAQTRRNRKSRALRAEAAVDALLLRPAQEAALQAFHWLQCEYPLTLLRPRGGVCLCRLGDKSAAVLFLQKSACAQPDDLLAPIRLAQRFNAGLCFVCGACDFSEAAYAFAASLETQIILLDRRLTARLAEKALPLAEPPSRASSPQEKASFFQAVRRAVLRRSLVPRYVVAFVLTALGFVQTRRFVYLLCALVCAALLAGSAKKPRKHLFPEL